jgi:ribosomal protein L40E
MSEALQSLTCSQCGGSPLKDNGDGTISCPFCGSTFAHPERVCPRCETVNELDARLCVSCGEKLREPCVRCGALNAVNASYCHECGAGLDLLEHIAARRAVSDADRLQQLQSEATRIKEDTERASQERMSKFWAQEQTRLQSLAKAKAEQQRQERLIWILATCAVIILVIVLMALGLMALLPH